MGKQKLIESVKVSRAFVINTAAEQIAAKFKINMGRNEVVILLAYYLQVVFSAAAQTIFGGIYRKSEVVDSDPGTTEAVEDENWVHWASWAAGLAAFTGNTTQKEYFQLPYPMVLIRPPQLVMDNQQAASVSMNGTLYYVTERLSDIEIAKLMVKDHD